jgi:hypothetical protein
MSTCSGSSGAAAPEHGRAWAWVRGKPGVQVNGSEERDSERGGRWPEFDGAQAWLPRTAGVDGYAGVLGLLGGRLLRFGSSNNVTCKAAVDVAALAAVGLRRHKVTSVWNAITNACQTKRRAESARGDT